MWARQHTPSQNIYCALPWLCWHHCQSQNCGWAYPSLQAAFPSCFHGKPQLTHGRGLIHHFCIQKCLQCLSSRSQSPVKEKYELSSFLFHLIVNTCLCPVGNKTPSSNSSYIIQEGHTSVYIQNKMPPFNSMHGWNHTNLVFSVGHWSLKINAWNILYTPRWCFSQPSTHSSAGSSFSIWPMFFPIERAPLALCVRDLVTPTGTTALPISPLMQVCTKCIQTDTCQIRSEQRTVVYEALFSVLLPVWTFAIFYNNVY